MMLASQQLVAVLLLAISMAMSLHHTQTTKRSTLDAAIDDEQDHGVPSRLSRLPGFNNMIQTSDPPTDADVPADAAFNSSCRHVSLDGYGKVGETTLKADCKDGHGRWWSTTINLNDCIGNEGGSLVYAPGGNFDKTCRPCFIDATKPGKDILLKCNCLERPGAVPKYTSLQIGTMVDNQRAVKPVDGQFICGAHNGTKSPAW